VTTGYVAVRLFGEGPAGAVSFVPATLAEVNPLLAAMHYLGPISAARYVYAGLLDCVVVAAMVWRWPTARYLPNDGTWLELSRWCLTPEAGLNAGSRMHGRVVRDLRRRAPHVTTLVSYSDPSQGHTGALYKACNWRWAPTWHRLRPPPSGNGSWSGRQQAVKDRWVFELRRDSRRAEVLAVKDDAIARTWPR
jgi:hypothetical protein